MELPLLDRKSSCTACALYAGVSKHVCVPSIWMPDSCPPGSKPIVCVVAQNPGYHEDDQCEPLVGKAGRYTREVLLGSSIDGRPSLRTLSTIYLMNTARCATPVDQPPSAAQYKTCSEEFLHPELEAVRKSTDQPMIVFCLGRFAGQSVWRYLTGERVKASINTFTRLNGSTHKNISFVCTYHPAAFLRERSYLESIVNHIRIIQDLLLGTAPKVTKPNTIRPYAPTP